MTRFLALAVLLALPPAVAGDASVPFLTPRALHQDVILEIGEEATDYRFWLLSGGNRLEPLPLTHWEPLFISAENHGGAYRGGCVIAVPRALVEQRGEQEICKTILVQGTVPGLLRSESISFRVRMSFCDSRERALVRYRVEIDAPNELRLVFLEDNAGNGWLIGLLVVAGILMSALSMWFGFRIARRGRQSQPATG